MNTYTERLLLKAAAGNYLSYRRLRDRLRPAPAKVSLIDPAVPYVGGANQARSLNSKARVVLRTTSGQETVL